MYANLYQKSILFEIINLKNLSEVVTAFTLTVPPDSIEITQGQRITRTKTFGGVFQDDYGMDVARITISGLTGNEELRATYIPGKGGALQQFSGKQAIYAFRDKIARYKDLLAGKGFESYEMRMYDLSTLPDANALDTIQESSTDGWIVSLDDFKMTRSKDRPLWYGYTIELVGIAPLPSVRPKPKDVVDPYPSSSGPGTVAAITLEVNSGAKTQVVPSSKDWLHEGIGSLTRVMNAIRGGFSWTTNLINKIDNVFQDIAALQDAVTEYITASGTILSSGFGFYQRLFEVAKFPAAVAKATMQSVVSVLNECETAMETTQEAPYDLSGDWDQLYQLLEEAKRIIARITQFGKSQAADTDVTVSIAGQEVSVYGTTVVKATDGTTLARLAAENYGDPSLGALIAMFNGITDDDINPGDSVRVPLIVRLVLVDDNKVYSWDRTSTYGSDIAFNFSSGAFRLVIAESGDFSFVSGEDNLIQAINLRLNESLGKRLRLVVYGLQAAVGSPRTNAAPVSYILTNLQDTLKQDPRIRSVESIRLLGDGDKLNISFNVRAVEDLVPYEGVI